VGVGASVGACSALLSSFTHTSAAIVRAHTARARAQGAPRCAARSLLGLHGRSVVEHVFPRRLVCEDAVEFRRGGLDGGEGHGAELGERDEPHSHERGQRGAPGQRSTCLLFSNFTPQNKDALNGARSAAPLRSGACDEGARHVHGGEEGEPCEEDRGSDHGSLGLAANCSVRSRLKRTGHFGPEF
jgi:hypothetical protein